MMFVAGIRRLRWRVVGVVIAFQVRVDEQRRERGISRVAVTVQHFAQRPARLAEHGP